MKNKKWIKHLIFIVIILAVIITAIVYFYDKSNKKTSNISKKIKDELAYLDSSTVYMINSLNNLNNMNSIQIQKMGGSDSSGGSSGSSSSSEESSEESENQKSNSQSQPSGGSSNSSGGNNGGGKNTQTFSIQNNPVMFGDKEKVNWNNLEYQAENLYTSWMSIALDLNNANVSNDNILTYNQNLDNLITSINKKDKNNSAICLANLYSLIPKYMEETRTDARDINLEKIKSNVISAYSIAGSGNWDEVNKKLAQAETDLINFINSESSAKDTNQTRINKCYVLLKELIKSSNEKNIDLFNLKYVNLINELEKV